MLEAQSMFKTANKITRAEKALILGFMAGSRGEIKVIKNVTVFSNLFSTQQKTHARIWAAS